MDCYRVVGLFFFYAVACAPPSRLRQPNHAHPTKTDPFRDGGVPHALREQLYDAVDQRRVEGGAGAEEGPHLRRHPPRLGGHEHAPDAERRQPTGMGRRGSPLSGTLSDSGSDCG